MAGDPAKDVDLDPGIGEPGQSRVPEIVAAQVLVAELVDHVVPVSRVAQDSGEDASAARAGEKARVGIGPGGQDALRDQGADFLDDGNSAGRLPLVRLLIDEEVMALMGAPTVADFGRSGVLLPRCGHLPG